MGQEHSGGGDISRSLALMWGYDDKAAGGPGPRPRLTLEAIVDRAVAVADAEGLDAVSMRRVATELGVGTMSLYRYLPGKAELLDLMLERVSALDEDARLDDDWREAMRAMGTGLWRLYTEHPWLPLVDQTRPLLGPNALRGFDLAVGALSGTGNARPGEGCGHHDDRLVCPECGPQRERYRGGGAAHGSEQRGVLEGPGAGAGRGHGDRDYPHVAALDEDGFEMPGQQFFEFGLQRILDGIEVLVDRRRSPG
jgi:AcrR family transcriptional regulator